MLCMILLACKQQGVKMTESLSNQLMKECDPEYEQELYSIKSPAELEKEQRALIVRFVKECNPVQRHDVHATSNPNVLKGWLWDMLQCRKVPDTTACESSRIWLIDVDHLDLCMLFTLLIDTSGVSPFAVAMKLQQVTRETQPPNLNCLGDLWAPLLRAWRWQGRLQMIGISPASWIVLTSDALTLVQLLNP